MIRTTGFEAKGWAWVFAPRGEVIDSDHPDYAYWMEQDEIERWIDAGCPPVGEWNGETSPKAAKTASAPDVPVHLMLALTKAQAGAMLGGKSVDWIERYVLPEVKTIRPSAAVLIPTDELQRWVRENAASALGR